MYDSKTQTAGDARLPIRRHDLQPAPLSMRRLAYLLLLATLMTIPLEDIFQVPGIGTLARAFGIAAFAIWALSAFARGHMRQPDLFHSFAFALAAWVGFSLLWSFDPHRTLVSIETYLQLLTLSLVVWDLCDSSRTINSAIQALVVGMWLASISLFLNFARGIESDYGRFSASGADPNYMAVMVAFGIPLAAYLVMHTNHRGLRLLNLAYIPAAGLVMGLTGSRGGFLAGFVAAVYLLTTARRQRPSGLIALVLAVVATVALVSLVVPDSALERTVSLGDEIGQGDLNGRVAIWLEAWDAFVQYPVAGIGAGASRAVLPTGNVPHNVAITLALELGIIGFALFAGMVATALRSSHLLTPRDRRMWWAVFGIWVVGSMSLNLETRKLTWVIFSLLLAATAMARYPALAGAEEVDDLRKPSPAFLRPF